MKVSQGIHCWLEYHKLHSKKHPKDLPVDPFQIHRPILGKRPKHRYLGGNPPFPHRNQSRNQTANQTDAIFPTHLVL